MLKLQYVLVCYNADLYHDVFLQRCKGCDLCINLLPEIHSNRIIAQQCHLQDCSAICSGQSWGVSFPRGSPGWTFSGCNFFFTWRWTSVSLSQVHVQAQECRGSSVVDQKQRTHRLMIPTELWETYLVNQWVCGIKITWLVFWNQNGRFKNPLAWDHGAVCHGTAQLSELRHPVVLQLNYERTQQAVCCPLHWQVKHYN